MQRFVCLTKLRCRTLLLNVSFKISSHIHYLSDSKNAPWSLKDVQKALYSSTIYRQPHDGQVTSMSIFCISL